MAGVSRWPGMLSPGPAREFTRSPAILTLPGRAVASVLGERYGDCGRAFSTSSKVKPPASTEGEHRGQGFA